MAAVAVPAMNVAHVDNGADIETAPASNKKRSFAQKAGAKLKAARAGGLSLACAFRGESGGPPVQRAWTATIARSTRPRGPAAPRPRRARVMRCAVRMHSWRQLAHCAMPTALPPVYPLPPSHPDFLLQGDMVSMLVAFVVGAAFTTLVKAFIADLVTPLIAGARTADTK